ncbi:Pkinase-domain-containing protein [Lentinula edodes]|uniref:Pkinase-domain-containing protein n=1 Tax=Lentinula edodes TaxID=5353 RepID=A0A1Q3EFA7_LENED|nr:Pkinase-domain-containing protein [Lentinula edodes]
MPATTVPCQYRTGRTLGSGTYAIVKEAIHIKTGKYYACKVINKKLMEGREHMVRNEIAVLKRISSGNRNVVTLHDYFETAHNLYLCFDLCTGGELFDRICAKGNYYEGDAASLVRTIMTAVSYIHSAGIVHRDLKPENLLFRTTAEDADIMIADFGLSRVMEGGIGGEKLNLLTEICGTPGYMAPEIFKKTGHGKPVDVWAMGVVTYFLLAGYTPFDRESQQAEMEAIIAGDYKFEPQEYWANAYSRRVFGTQGGPTDLLPHVKKAFNAKGLWRKAAFSIRALNRMTVLAGSGYTFSNNHAEAQRLREDVATYKEESEKEKMEDASIIHQYQSDSNPSSPASPTHSKHMSQGKDTNAERQKEAAKKQDDISVDNQNDQSLATMMAKVMLSEKVQEVEKEK